MKMQLSGQSLRLVLQRTLSGSTTTVRKHHTHAGAAIERSKNSTCNYQSYCSSSKALGRSHPVSLQPICRRFCSVSDEAVRPLTAFHEQSKTFRDAVRKFAQQEIRPLVLKMDEESRMSLDVISALFQQGFMGMAVEASEGGSGMSVIDSMIVVEELSRVDPSVGLLVGLHNSLVLRAVDLHGTEEQKKHYLPKLCSETIGSFCLSESGCTSDVISIQCSATRDEEQKGWRLNGSKQWIANSAEAGLFLVFASSDSKKKNEGTSCFLVDAESEGFSVGQKCDKLGIRASSTCEITMDNVFVPDNRVLGPLGAGYKMATEILNESRISTAALMLGLAQGALDATVPYLIEHEQSGKILADIRDVRLQTAELATEIEATRLLVYNAAALKSAGLPFVKEAAMAKYKASCVAEKVASRCIEIFGDRGYTKEYPLEKYYRDAKSGAIYEGTGSRQLKTIFTMLEKEYV